MFDHLPIGVYRCTPQGDFIDANPALVRILGYPDPATLEKSYTTNYCQQYILRNAPGRTRTCDLRIRSPLLYPAELRAPETAGFGRKPRGS